MIGGHILQTHAVASSYTCHRMCCGPDKSPMVRFTYQVYQGCRDACDWQ